MVNPSTESNKRYLAKMSLQERREYERLKKARYRERKKQRQNCENKTRQFYSEEDAAWRECSAVEKSLPEAPPLPKLPSTGYCNWSFDEKTRVVMADFSKQSGPFYLVCEDEEFMLNMMERDDISLIVDGLADDMDPFLWNMEYINRTGNGKIYSKIKLFRKTDFNNERDNGTNDEVTNNIHIPIKGTLRMTLGDYYKYLILRKRVLTEDDRSIHSNEKSAYKFNDDAGISHEVDVRKDILYMIDCDMKQLPPSLCIDFHENFKLRCNLPGGKNCLLSEVS